MNKFDKELNQTHVNAILRRLNEDEDFKISFREFAENISPTLQGFTPEGCLTRPTDPNIPKEENCDDILPKSKFLNLLEHDGMAFNLE
mmetsp:Transcript_5908/g.9610  ORF Transcript_5908/g.9610 Transcript_5908/m.9610 type:complete len:88 (+) Transcript_5908:575-838(+)